MKPDHKMTQFDLWLPSLKKIIPPVNSCLLIEITAFYGIRSRAWVQRVLLQFFLPSHRCRRRRSLWWSPRCSGSRVWRRRWRWEWMTWAACRCSRQSAPRRTWSRRGTTREGDLSSWKDSRRHSIKQGKDWVLHAAVRPELFWMRPLWFCRQTEPWPRGTWPGSGKHMIIRIHCSNLIKQELNFLTRILQRF